LPMPVPPPVMATTLCVNDMECSPFKRMNSYGLKSC
jgi:hypothetical protein